MHEIQIKSVNGVEILKQISNRLNGTVKERWGEYVLEFNNEIGSGTIRAMSFDWGVSLLDYDVNFKEDIKIIYNIGDINPIEFIFVSNGELDYHTSSDTEDRAIIERYQNIIFSSKRQSKEYFIFPKDIHVKANFIYIFKKEYAKKKNNNLSYLNFGLQQAFSDSEENDLFKHYGSFNLKIADQVKTLNENRDNGIVKSLNIEAQLYIILAMQILEYNNYEDDVLIHDSLSKEEIRKIHKLTAYILDHISEPLTVNNLAQEVGINVKKLQSGFRVLYSKSVNEYIREIKLEIARDHIKNSDYSISEIVYNIGLKSRSYFSKIFFERYGLLPTEFRKKIKASRKDEVL